MALYRKIILENKIKNYACCQKGDIDLGLVNGPYVWDIGLEEILNENCVSLFQKYPEPPEDDKLIKLLAAFEGVPEDYIMLTPGADVGIELVCRQFLESGDSACIVVPTFPRFEIVLATISGIKIEYKRLLGEISKDYKLIFLCTPNNPTTEQLNEKDLRVLVENYPNSLICVDSVFERFGDYSVVDLCRKYDNVVVLKSFSKIGLAGLRLGYLISNSDNINYLRVGQSPFSVPAFSQKIGVQIIKQIHRLEQFDQIVEDSFRQIQAVCKDRVLRGSRVPFYLLKTGIDSTKAAILLLNSGISVVDGKNFRGMGNNFLRVALGSGQENAAFLKVIQNKGIL